MTVFDLDTIVEEWLTQTLFGSAALLELIGRNTVTDLPQVYWELAPEEGVAGPLPGQDSPPPYVVCQSQSGGMNILSALPEMVWGDGLWLVKVVGLGNSADTVRRANAVITRLLDGAVGDTSEGRVNGCEFQQSHTPPTEVLDGVTYFTRGGIYHITAQPRDGS
jgi:hypothetical protein